MDPTELLLIQSEIFNNPKIFLVDPLYTQLRFAVQPLHDFPGRLEKATHREALSAPQQQALSDLNTRVQNALAHRGPKLDALDFLKLAGREISEERHENIATANVLKASLNGVMQIIRFADTPSPAELVGFSRHLLIDEQSLSVKRSVSEIYRDLSNIVKAIQTTAENLSALADKSMPHTSAALATLASETSGVILAPSLHTKILALAHEEVIARATAEEAARETLGWKIPTNAPAAITVTG